MHYRRLGKLGIKVSEISLGTFVTFGNQIDDKTASDLVHSAFEHGVNFFDSADVYAKGRAEEVLGHAIADIPRENLILASKVFFPVSEDVNGRGLSRKHIVESLHASLKRMGVEYLDIYYCHRHDPDTTVQEVVQTMDMLVRRGEIMYWGTSQWSVFHLMRAMAFAKQNGLIPPMVEQPKYNLFNRTHVENDLAPLCSEYGIGLTTCSPLNSGVLSGKYNDGVPQGSRAAMQDMGWMQTLLTPEAIDRVRRLTQIATSIGATPAQISIAWQLRRNDVSSVICGATRLEQLDENLAASDYTNKLSDEVLDQIDSIFM